MRTFLVASAVAAAVGGGYLLLPQAASTSAAPATPAALPAAPVPPAPAAARVVAHEWGTFTSFSGANGVPVSFSPNNEDLPNFVYFPINQFGKAPRLRHNGLVSMETPVVYFYADRETKVSLTVDFPKGWITEWYPAAATPPGMTSKTDKGGQTIKWDVKLTPGEAERYPTEKTGDARPNHYYFARETDATPLQTEVLTPQNGEDRDRNEYALRGGSVLQREKFLFYRGVGTFEPPVTVQALGGDRVRVVNKSGGKAAGLVLVTVRDGKIGFRPLAEVETGATAEAQLPALTGSRTELGTHLVKELIAAGLYEKEAKAMVKTWDSAWFGEEGSRLLYLVPRDKTDELLPLTMNPKPAELVRVLVGRHDFLTPEVEATALAELKRMRAAEKERDEAYRALHKLGRFSNEAQRQAEQKLDGTAGK
jgi:hypothetical protein